MKKVLFASTATAALAIGGMASAQGISLFGDARLGLGYNINNDGSVQGDDNIRAISRVRFGVNMTGETDSGITFGATIRADNAAGGQGGKNGQTAGNVFVSGGFGTLTFGDTNGADEQWVGDLPGDYSLTGLGDLDETPFISNGGGFGDDNLDFANNPTARPTIRYDFDIMGFGLSLSSNRDLTDIGVGGGYSGQFGATSFSVGVGYYDFDEFPVVTGSQTSLVGVLNANGTPKLDPVTGLPVTTTVAGADIIDNAPAGHQWSASINADYNNFGFGVVYTNADAGETSFETLGAGASAGFNAFTVGAFYTKVLNSQNTADDLSTINDLDQADAYGLTAQYDLGGGARVAAGVVRTYGEDTVADFGIGMAF